MYDVLLQRDWEDSCFLRVKRELDAWSKQNQGGDIMWSIAAGAALSVFCLWLIIERAAMKKTENADK